MTVSVESTGFCRSIYGFRYIGASYGRSQGGWQFLLLTLVAEPEVPCGAHVASVTGVQAGPGGVVLVRSGQKNAVVGCQRRCGAREARPGASCSKKWPILIIILTSHFFGSNIVLRDGFGGNRNPRNHRTKVLNPARVSETTCCFSAGFVQAERVWRKTS